jgi:hypothetical protein
MSQQAITIATRIYEAAARQRTEYHLVSDPEVAAFYDLTSRLRKRWREMPADDHELFELSRTLGWLANTAVGTPLPLGIPDLSRFFIPNEFAINLRRMTLAYPELQTDIDRVLGQLDRLVNADVTRLALKAAELIYAAACPAVITIRPWLNRQLAQYLAELTVRDDVAVLRHADLCAPKVYDRLIVIGPANWLSFQLLRAVRADQRDVVSIDCFPVQNTTGSILPEAWAPRTSVRFVGSVPPAQQVVAAGAGDLDGETDFLGNFEVSSILTRLRTSPDTTGDASTPLVDAEAFQLSSGEVLLLAAEGRTFALDREGDRFRVQPRKPTDLEPNQCVILRTQRDRELIAELADRILGDRAEPLRGMQRGWKQTLSRRIMTMDANRVAASLRSRGMGSIATPVNVCRWAGPDFIRNQDFATWQSLMSYLGLEGMAKQLWDDMDIIDRAHRAAGHRISGAIERALAQLSLDEVQDGMELPPIPDLGEERLSVFEIADRLGPVSDVRFTDLNRPIQM